MARTKGGPFREVRPREPRENLGEGKCSLCKQPFSFVAVRSDKSKIFYWCIRCDVVRDE